jgi:hypothetical protein
VGEGLEVGHEEAALAQALDFTELGRLHLRRQVGRAEQLLDVPLDVRPRRLVGRVCDSGGQAGARLDPRLQSLLHQAPQRLRHEGHASLSGDNLSGNPKDHETSPLTD